jgi:predicted DNA-binding antitoxin AbrB/MazE fold protein
MNTTLNIEAVYKDGVLIPFQKIDLEEGEKVQIQIKEKKGKIVSLRGLWKGIKISEEDIYMAKGIWEEGAEKQIKIIEKDNAK